MGIELRRVLALAVGFVATCAGCGGSDGPSEAPAPAPALGYSEVYAPGELDTELLASSGAEIARRPLNWTSVEPLPGRLDWSLYDALAKDLQRAGVRPIWVVTSAPCWAAADPTCEADTPSYAPAREHFDELAAFVTAVAERYPDSAAIEIWNEPNLERFFIGGRGPRYYARMLDAAARAIEGSGSEVPVVSAGPSPVEEGGPARREWTSYLRRVLAAGGAERVDAVGLHIFSKFDPEQGLAPTVSDQLSDARTVLERAGVERPLWITEVGVSTAGPQPVSAERQATELAAAFELARDESVPVMVVHRLFDQPDPEFPIESGYGVVEADRTTRKPAYCELAHLAGEPCG